MPITRAPNPRPDIIIHRHGGLFSFQPMTALGRNWISDYVASEPWQWYAGALMIDQHYAGALAQGMAKSGLVIK